MLDQVSEAAQQSPVRVNTHRDQNAMFTYGPTKCAVILKNMVETFDAHYGGNFASRLIGNRLRKVDEMLDLVTLKYKEIEEHRKKTNLLTAQEKGGFKEHLVYGASPRTPMHYGLTQLPREMLEMFEAVVKERINMRKFSLGIAPQKKGIDYTPWQLVNWVNEDYVKKARMRFKRMLNETKRPRPVF
jgi:hypothetical protein